jgi:beta-lactam-binding protein with PASTA domain
LPQAAARRTITVEGVDGVRRLAVVFAFAGLLVAGVAPGHAGAQQGEPGVVGLSLREAVAELEAWDADVRLTVVPDPLPPELDWGEALVFDQRDVAVETGTEIELLARAVVPDVEEMDLADALAVLASRGLAANAKVYGTVVGQSLDPDTVVPFGVVLWLDVAVEGLSTAPPRVETVDVPDVVGQRLPEAQGTFLRAGLEPSERLRGVGEPGVVVDQEPPAGTTVAVGTVAMAIAEASVPPPSLSVVPDVVGAAVGEAQAELEGAGLGFELRLTSTVPHDEPSAVVGQEPEAGTEVDAGTVVTVFADPLVYVPDLAGLDEGAARDVLAAKGLEMDFAVDGEGEDLRVREQSPPPDDLVAVGTAVWALAVPAGVGPVDETATPPEDGGGDGDGAVPWLWIGAALVGAAVVMTVLTGLAARRASRRRRARRLQQRVRVVAVDVPDEPAVDEGAGPDRSHTVRLEPHDRAPVQTIEEEVRR